MYTPSIIRVPPSNPTERIRIYFSPSILNLPHFFRLFYNCCSNEMKYAPQTLRLQAVLHCPGDCPPLGRQMIIHPRRLVQRNHTLLALDATLSKSSHLLLKTPSLPCTSVTYIRSTVLEKKGTQKEKEEKEGFVPLTSPTQSRGPATPNLWIMTSPLSQSV
jgi:hypothetical protein